MPDNISRLYKAMRTKKFLIASGLLIIILALLFRESFNPNMVAFSNDAPLGQSVSDQVLMPGIILGQWFDLNTIGVNAESASPNISNIIKFLWECSLKTPFGPLGYANSYAPIGLFILGLGALSFFKQLKFSPLASFFGAIAVMLNSIFFGVSCWGIASLAIAMGFNFFALALIVANTNETSKLIQWIQFALAGLCVGMNVMESADVGALASVLIAIFVFYKAFVDEARTVFNKVIRGASRVCIVTVFALFIALQSVVSLVGVAINGVAGTAQDAQTKATRWDFATQWSLPKVETLGLFVPGLFGFKMDTPNEMPPYLQNAYQGGVYWGGMGRDPANDRVLDSNSNAPMPNPQWMRQTGNGNYCGIVVVLIGAWAIAQSLRRRNSIFSDSEKKMIWFWTVVLFSSLVIAWGRFAPFYAMLYHLPYFSTIRNPTKFITFFSWALTIVFAYGINALNRFQLNPTGKPVLMSAWWKNASKFDRKWTFISIGLLLTSLVGWLIYNDQKSNLIQYLQLVGFGNVDIATQIATFSINQAGWFIGLFSATVILLIMFIAGFFKGSRSKIAIVIFSTLLLFDFVRADLPYIIHWNYVYKYEVGSLNPVESFLCNKPYEHRVAVLPFDAQVQLRAYDNNFGGLGLYRIEWAQHHFPYYNIQSLDIIQMPRMPEDLKEYLEALSPHSMSDIALDGRLWQLTNTRYLLGASGFLDVLNEKLDPNHERFQIAQRFDIVAKYGVVNPTSLEDLTAATNSDGDLALFEFTGALPRAKLYSNWEVNTNNQSTLKTLADLNFDPSQTVLVSTPLKDWSITTNLANTGTVDYQSYGPDKIILKVNATTPSILLLNDRYDSHWKVTVDGKPAELLRCNFIMRGVCVPTGQHTVMFQFRMPLGPLYITLSAIGLGILLCIVLILHKWRIS